MRLPKLSFMRSSRLKNGKKGVFFLHLGKCGGSSIVSGLTKRMNACHGGHINTPVFQRALSRFVDRTDFACYYPHLMAAASIDAILKMESRYKFIHGHVPFVKEGMIGFRDKYEFVTLLREPASRLISSYRYSRRLPQEHGCADEEALKVRFRSYLDSAEGRLAANTFCYYLSGIFHSFEFGELRDQAIANLRHFSLVGVLEDLDGFAKEFTKLGFGKPKFGRKNETDKKFNISSDPLPAKLQHSKEIQDLVRTVTTFDQSIYDYVIKERGSK